MKKVIYTSKGEQVAKANGLTHVTVGKEAMLGDGKLELSGSILNAWLSKGYVEVIEMEA